jgi:hypothetical protein
MQLKTDSSIHERRDFSSNKITFGLNALRRYAASVLADTNKVSAKTIQRILRHKNLSTAERYMQNLNKDLRETMNLLPVGNMGEENSSEKTYPTRIPQKAKGPRIVLLGP